MDRATAAGYLAGLIDGEGSVVFGRWGPAGPRKPGGKKQYRVVVCVNTDPTIIKAAERACDIMGYEYITRQKPMPNEPNRKDIWVITIYRAESIRRLLDEVPIQARKKKANLKAMVASFRVSKRPPREVLEQLYVDEERPVSEILEELGLSKPMFYRYLWHYGISRDRHDLRGGKARAREITKELLHELYVEERLPTYEIARRLEVCSDTLYHQLKKHGIPRDRYRRVR